MPAGQGICQCGRVLPAHTLAVPKQLLASFQASLEKANRYRDQDAFEQRLQTAAAAADILVLQEFSQEAQRIEMLAKFAASKPAKIPKSQSAAASQGGNASQPSHLTAN